jgi:phosphatidylinositol alpha-1,6-mannosyltransferase
MPSTPPAAAPARTAALDILLCQRFLPEVGGSITWMHEVYRRWPGPVDVITHDYYGHPTLTPECPHRFERPAGGDHVTDANLRMDRRDIFIRDWGLEDPRRAWRYLRMMRAVQQRLRDPAHRGKVVRVHAVHAVPEVACLLPLKLRYGRRLRILCYAHGEEVNACLSSRQLKMLMLQAHKIIDVMLANSRYTRSRLGPYIDESKLRVVNPGVSIGSFDGAQEAGRRWRATMGYGQRRLVLTLGRLDPRKNQAAVLAAVAAIKDRYPDMLYVVAGMGRQLDSLRQQARELGVAERVIFPGAVDNEQRIAMYGACDVFAMPAIQDGPDVEGFGMVFLEAGACGRPSIAGCVGGQPDAVQDGQTGLIVDGTQQDAVTGALDRLLGDEALRQRLGEGARQYAQGFDWPRVVQRVVDLADELQ